MCIRDRFSTLFNALPMCVAAQNSGVEVMSGVASRFVTAIAGVIFGLMAIFPKFSQILALSLIHIRCV